MLHLRLSGFDINPLVKAFRSPASRPRSFQTHLVPQTPSTVSPVEAVTGHLDVRDPHHGNAPPTSPSPTYPEFPLDDYWVNPQGKF